MEPTETMEVPPLEAGAEKKGRGPTRPEVKFADLVGDVRGDVEFFDAMKRGETAKACREAIRLHRAAIKSGEQMIAHAERIAALLSRVEELPEHLRRALIATLSETEAK